MSARKTVTEAGSGLADVKSAISMRFGMPIVLTKH